MLPYRSSRCCTLLRRSSFSLTLLILVFVSYEAQAQWPRGKGKGYIQLSLGRADASRGFDANRNRGPLGSLENPEQYEETALYAYGEYGLTNRLTLIGSTFLKSAEGQNLNGSFSNSGLSDLTLLLRYSPPQIGPVVISPQVGVSIPTGYDPADSPPLGSGELDLLAQVTFGVSFWPAPAYLSSSIGFKQRGGIIQNEIISHVEAGYFVTEKILLRGRGDLTESTTNTTSDFSQLEQVTEKGYLTAGPGVSVLLSPRWQLHADLRWTLSGRTTANLSSGIVGLAFLW